jgi:hypothetical protein
MERTANLDAAVTMRHLRLALQLHAAEDSETSSTRPNDMNIGGRRLLKTRVRLARVSRSSFAFIQRIAMRNDPQTIARPSNPFPAKFQRDCLWFGKLGVKG